MIELLNTPEQTLDVGRHVFGPFPVPSGHNVFRCNLNQVNWPIVKPYLLKLSLLIDHDGEGVRETSGLMDGTSAIDEATKQPLGFAYISTHIGCVGTGNPENPMERRMRLTNDKAMFGVALELTAPIRTAIQMLVGQDMPSDPPQHIIDVPDFLK